MKGIIYKITNNINKKVYIGKTYCDAEKRFKEHIRDSRRERCKNRPLYRAFNKYGIENFSHEVLGEYEEKELEDMEVYYIDQFDSYHNGYNATHGGDGTRYLKFDEEEVIAKYKELGTVIHTAQHYKCGVDTIRKILRSHNIEIVNNGGQHMKAKSKKVSQYTMSGIWVQDFASASEASRQFEKGSSGSIARCCQGERKTYKGYKWKYTEETNNDN